MPRKRDEQVLHQSVARYLSLALAPEVVWTSVGHGGGGAVRGAILKSMGLKRGVADIYIAWKHQTLWVELKAPKGVASIDQLAFSKAVRAIGHEWSQCKSLDSVISTLAALDCPMRGRLT